MNGKHVVIIIAEGYSEADMWTAYYRFQEEGADVIVAGPKKGTVYGRGLRGKDGRKAEITHTIEEARQLPCDLIFLPGGTWSAMELRMYDPTLHYIKTQIDKGVLVCAVEHAAWILISSGAVKGRKICCTSDCGDDIANSGGIYLPGPGAVQDGNLITASDYSQIYKLMRLVMKQSKQKKDVNVVNNLEGEGAQESLLMNGKRVLLIIAKGYTEPELWSPCQRFLEEGAEVIVAKTRKRHDMRGRSAWN